MPRTGKNGKSRGMRAAGNELFPGVEDILNLTAMMAAPLCEGPKKPLNHSL